MNDSQWRDLLRVVNGELVDPVPVGLIIDSPWLPQWAGCSILDYFHDPHTWLRANLEAIRRFERITFLPGFWSEYGMCTEPSAFGAKCVWSEHGFPTVEKMLHEYSAIDHLTKPDCRTHGLLPFVLKRLCTARRAIEQSGHRIRFAVARGPLNIASYLLGHTELLIGLKTYPEKIHQLLAMVTEFLVDWIGLQSQTFESIDGIFLLDDLIGFLGDEDFEQFAVPYLKAVFASKDVSVRFLHNDAHGLITARHLSTLGVNLFNFSFEHSIAEDSVVQSMQGVADRRRIMISCGGGAPPGAPTQNLLAMCEGAELIGASDQSCLCDQTEEDS
jgi:uroporphyrinogen decarboxylase